MLPNFEISVLGTELGHGDRIALDTYATQVSDLVWRLDRAKLLAAVEEGRPIKEVREFLNACSCAAIPDTVAGLGNSHRHGRSQTCKAPPVENP